jgi:hypothetical protein
MDDAPLVGGIERVRDLDRQVEHCLDRQGTPCDTVLQGAAGEVLEHYEGLPVVFTDVVRGADARMAEGRRGSGLALEPVEGLPILSERLGKELEGDGAPEARILGLVHDTHAAATELSHDAVMRVGASDHPGSSGKSGSG